MRGLGQQRTGPGQRAGAALGQAQCGDVMAAVELGGGLHQSGNGMVAGMRPVRRLCPGVQGWLWEADADFLDKAGEQGAGRLDHRGRAGEGERDAGAGPAARPDQDR